MASDEKGGNDIAFGPFRVARRSRSLTRDGRLVPMGGRAFDVLVVLAAALGETVSKDALLDQAWPGLTVEENNLQVQISALRKTLGEAWIMTVPGRGYRLTVPPTNEEHLPRQEIFVGKPSIAVLPFTNVSGDVGQEYFSDGIAEDIITELSHNQSLLVIARSSSFSYKGRAVDVREVARDLGVRYVLEGSVRRDGVRVRISAQLIDAEVGNHVWANRYDRDLTDIFQVQDEITGAVATVIGPAISEAEQRRAIQKPTASLSAWEAYHTGLWHVSTGNGIARGLEFFRLAVTLDPLFSEAHASMALFYLVEGTGGGGRSLHDALILAESAARTALRLNDANGNAHAQLAWVFALQGNVAPGLEQAERAIALNANDPTGYLAKGRILVYAHRPIEARAAVNTALRLDPRGALVSLGTRLHLAISYYFERDYVAAEATASQTLRAYPDFPRPYPWFVASLGQLGRKTEAERALREAMAAAPDFFNFHVRTRPPWSSQEDYEHLLEGLRKAGWEG